MLRELRNAPRRDQIVVKLIFDDAAIAIAALRIGAARMSAHDVAAITDNPITIRRTDDS